MYCHLIAIKVSVECSAHQGVNLDCFSFYQDRLKCLNAEAVEGRGAVEKYWVFLYNFFQDVPDFRSATFNHAFRGLDVWRKVKVIQALHNKWFEQLQCHEFGKSTLMQLESWAHHDH